MKQAKGIAIFLGSIAAIVGGWLLYKHFTKTARLKLINVNWTTGVIELATPFGRRQYSLDELLSGSGVMDEISSNYRILVNLNAETVEFFLLALGTNTSFQVQYLTFDFSSRQCANEFEDSRGEVSPANC